MEIRWRIGALALQVAILIAGTWLASGGPWANTLWFFSGLLAVALNRQLLEPFFARPVDTLANSIVGLFLVAVAEKHVARLGWSVAGTVLALAAALALVAQIFGGTSGRAARLARAARQVTTHATATPIYSMLFFLALFESFDPANDSFWILVTAWAAIVVIGEVNWQAAWSATQGRPSPARIVGFLGPSRLLVTRADLPRPGASVRLRSGTQEAEGVITRRVRRLADTYGEILLSRGFDPEKLLTGDLQVSSGSHEHGIIGVVDHGSTDRLLRFTATRELVVGDAVFVEVDEGELIYQITSAEVRRRDEQDGAHLETACTALQLGRWVPEVCRIERYGWVAPPGVGIASTSRGTYDVATPSGCLRLGTVIGSEIPVLLDLSEASTGHVLVLGMTKMGKTTLAMRLARALAQSRPVVILDQTGEYRTRHELPVCTAQSLIQSGLSLKEPAKGEVGPAVALEFFEKLLDQVTSDEYEAKGTQGRTVVIEEAHQFIPEPAGLGFGTPGRDEAYKLGTLMMQIRKYGLSVVLISQRTAVVGKSAISQCENVIAFRSVDRTGLEYLDGIMGRESVELLPRLKQGQAIVAGPAFNADEPIAVQLAEP